MGRWKRSEERDILEISAPTSTQRFVSSFKHSVIVVCIHGFKAENKYELTTNKGDILKVLDRPGNGWLLVQFIDTVNKYGLIPAKYVDIAVNDPLDPITLQWLHQIDELTSTAGEPHTQSGNSSTAVTSLKRGISMHNKTYPEAATITNVLLLENRYWYRLDIIYADNTKVYLPRYYEDFYNLHGSLLDAVRETDTPLSLPKLPEPIACTPSSQSGGLDEVLLKRCNDLSIYINRIFGEERFQKSKVLYEWLDISYRDLGGLMAHPQSNYTNEEITKRILPHSVDILTDMAARNRNENTKISKPTTSAFSKKYNLNSKKQSGEFDSFKIIRSLPPKLTVNTSNHNYNDSVGSHSETSIFSDIDSAKTPDTPFSFSHSQYILKDTYVKVKVIKPNEDIIVLKIDRNDIRSVIDLKRLVGAKVPYETLYIKLQDYKSIDSPSYNFSQVLGESEKIVLKAI